MAINHKQMYLLLTQQAKALSAELNPSVETEKVNEIPEDFNQIGWDLTIQKVEVMLEKMKKLREVKGRRLTPQFYRSIYNRSIIANTEIDKLMNTLTADENFDYAAGCIKLNAEIYELNQKIISKKEAEEAAATMK